MPTAGAPREDRLITLRCHALAVEQMCATLTEEVSRLSVEVAVLAEHPTVPPLSVSVDQASRLLGIGRSTMFGLLESGEVRSVKVGGRRLIPMRALDDFLSGDFVAEAG